MTESNATAGAAAPAEKSHGLVQDIRERWARSKWSVIAIFAAFALAGMSTLRISRPLLRWILGDHPPRWQWWTLRILLIVPMYEVVLTLWGIVLGQGSFFVPKQRRLVARITRPFRRSRR